MRIFSTATFIRSPKTSWTVTDRFGVTLGMGRGFQFLIRIWPERDADKLSVVFIEVHWNEVCRWFPGVEGLCDWCDNEREIVSRLYLQRSASSMTDISALSYSDPWRALQGRRVGHLASQRSWRRLSLSLPGWEISLLATAEKKHHVSPVSPKSTDYESLVVDRHSSEKISSLHSGILSLSTTTAMGKKSSSKIDFLSYHPLFHLVQSCRHPLPLYVERPRQSRETSFAPVQSQIHPGGHAGDTRRGRPHSGPARIYCLTPGLEMKRKMNFHTYDCCALKQRFKGKSLFCCRYVVIWHAYQWQWRTRLPRANAMPGPNVTCREFVQTAWNHCFFCWVERRGRVRWRKRSS